MDVLSDDQFEILAFIATCNRRTYLPTQEEVMLWRDNPRPRPATYRRVSSATRDPEVQSYIPALQALNAFDSTAIANRVVGNLNEHLKGLMAGWMGTALASSASGKRELVAPAETVIAHLVRLTWLQEVPSPRGDRTGLRLTELGNALRSDFEMTEAAEEDFAVVVLDKEDPLAYPTLIGRLSQVGEGLIVDPYLKLTGLHHLVLSTQLTRVLVSDKDKRQAAEVDAMRTYLDSPVLLRQVEVRVAKGLHDRVVIGDGGEVHTLGSSLNGVGRKTTVFSPIPAAAAGSLIKEYESLWADAEVVGPTAPPADDETAAGEAETGEGQGQVEA